MSNAKIHLAFLFSSPLVKKGINGNYIPMHTIDHNKEFAGLLDGLKQTNMKITYMRA
jgi:hypothetical protein